MAKEVRLFYGEIAPSQGSAGIRTQLPGCMASVSNLANSSGGIRKGGLVETDN